MSFHPSERFDFDKLFNPEPAGPTFAEMLTRAHSIKIDLYRDSDGDVHGDWSISGSVSRGAAVPEDVTEGLDFASQLLAAFSKARPEEGGCCQ